MPRSRPSLRRRPIPLAAASSQVWRSRAAMLPVYQTSLSILLASASLLHEVVPALRRLAIMANVAYAAAADEMREAQGRAQQLGIEATAIEIRRAEDIAP